MLYNIVLKKRVLKALHKIDEPYYSNIKKTIYSLKNNPRPIGYLKLKNRSGFRIRIDDYRVIYEIYDDILSVEVLEIGHRRDIYD